jgi:hypothetical protein
LRLRVSVISKLDSHELTAETATSSSNYAWDITPCDIRREHHGRAQQPRNA